MCMLSKKALHGKSIRGKIEILIVLSLQRSKQTNIKILYEKTMELRVENDNLWEFGEEKLCFLLQWN